MQDEARRQQIKQETSIGSADETLLLAEYEADAAVEESFIEQEAEKELLAEAEAEKELLEQEAAAERELLAQEALQHTLDSEDIDVTSGSKKNSLFDD